MNVTRLPRRFALGATAVLCLTLVACHRDKPEDHLAKGKDAATKRQHATAIIEFKNVLQADPKSEEARFLLGSELLAQGDPKAAEIELQKAYDAGYDPDTVVPLLVRSQVLQGKTDKIATAIAKGDLKSPTANAALQTLLGASLLAQGKPDDALAAYQAAQKFVPDYPDAHLGEARIKAGRKDVAGAEEEVNAVVAANPKNAEALVLKGDLARSHGALDDAAASYQAALKEDPRSFLAHMNLAGVYVTKRQLDLAQAQVNELKKLAPKHPGVNYMDALVSFTKKDFAHANDAINLTLTATPSSNLAQLLGGAISTALNQPAQAEAHLRDALKSNPNNVYARKLLTTLYLKQKQPAKADEALQPALARNPDDPALVTLAGEVALQKGDFPNASKYFERASKLDPSNGAIRTQGAAVEFARGDEASGFAELEAASKASAANASPDIALVLAHVQRKQYDQAFKAWQTLEQRQPDNPLTYNMRAAIELGRGDVAAAKKALERAVELQPTYFPAVANLASMDERGGNVDGARKRFKDLLAKDPGNLSALIALAQFEARHGASPDTVAGLLKEARRANPTSEMPVVSLAAFYGGRNDLKQALAVAQDGVAQLPTSTTLLALQGQLLMQTGSADQALAAYRKLVSINPESLDAQIRYGQAQLATGHADLAYATFQAALKTRSDAYAAQNAAIASLLRAGKVDEAAKLLADVHQQSPKSPVLPELDADLKLARHQYPDAASAYKRLLAQSPNSTLVIKTYSALSLAGNLTEANAMVAEWLKSHPKDAGVTMFQADMAIRAKDYSRAAVAYKTVLDLQPDNPAVLNNLAWALWQQKDPKAIGYAEKAESLSPTNPDIGDTLGWMLVEQGNVKRGLDLLQKAYAAAPQARSITLHLAKALIKDGRKEDARVKLQDLADAAPDSAEGKESQALMSSL